jgi:hypothetical protein
MASIRTLSALSSVAFLITACATATEPASTQGSAKPNADEHAGHHPAGAASAPAPAAGPTPDRMKSMREMHDKMMQRMPASGAAPAAK